MSYTVEVTREDDAWIATVVDLPGAHTFAKNLTALDTAVREVVGFIRLGMTSRSPWTMNTSTSMRLPRRQPDSVSGAKRYRPSQDRLGLETVERVDPLVKAGYSVRDISGLLGMSPGRVSQIIGCEVQGPEERVASRPFWYSALRGFRRTQPESR